MFPPQFEIASGYILFHLRNGEASKVPPPFPRDVQNPLQKRSACFALSNERLAMFTGWVSIVGVSPNGWFTWFISYISWKTP
jgi:hypothetical protein